VKIFLFIIQEGFMKFVLGFFICLSLISYSTAGKIVLCNDEWTLGDGAGAWAQPNDAGQFALNVADWFSDGPTGNFLVYSSNFGLTGYNLFNTMTNAGHNWTVTTDASVLNNLSTYDVFLEGGTGWGGSYEEAQRWNPFLNNFGLGFGTYYNGVGGNIAINSSHAIFTGVDHLFQNNGNDALDINTSDPHAQVLASYNGHGLYAAYEKDDVSVPEPGSLSLIVLGILSLLSAGAFRRKNN
jgi:hypothetical protein